MALIKCPYCAEEIQKDAVKCKHCKEWLFPKKVVSEKGQSDEIIPSRQRNNKKKPESLPSHKSNKYKHVKWISCPSCGGMAVSSGRGCLIIGLVIILFPIGLIFLLLPVTYECLKCGFRFKV